jgi:hypothetical protein
MKKIGLFFLSALILITASCKLDPAIFPDGTTPGTGEITTSTNTSASGYQPTTKGSVWKLSKIIRSFPAGQAPVTTTQAQVTTMTGETLKINNKTYYAATTTIDATKGYTYYYHGNDTYSYRSDLIAIGVTMEYIYLKDNYAIGQTWTAPVTDNGILNGFKAQIVGQIAEKGISLTVGTKTYADVIHTKLKFQYDTGSGFDTYQDIEYYIAKGVGIIYVTTEDHLSSDNKSGTSLTESIIK